MNATSLKDVRAGDALGDEKMDQVREILFGDFERRANARIQTLEARIRELETSLHQRIDAMQARLEAVAGEIETGQRAALDDIAVGLQELSDRVRRSPRG